MKFTLSIVSLAFLAACLLAAAPAPAAPAQPASTPSPRPASPAAAAPAAPLPPAPASRVEPSSSLLAHAVAEHSGATGADPASVSGRAPGISLFAVTTPQARQFNKHDLVQIIVRESSRTKRSQDFDAKKDYKLDGKITGWPDFNLADLLELQLQAGRTTDLPKVGFDVKKNFKAEGEYERQDDMTDRLTATVVDVLPNGNLVLEARTAIKTDAEESSMKVTGICRAADVSPANTLLSNQLFDLKIENMHKGELKDSAQKGIIAKVLDTIFAF